MTDLAQRLAAMPTPRTNDAVWETEDSHEDVVYAAEARALERENRLLRSLLIRYRSETPLGNQPHMIAAEVDAVLALLEGPR